MSDLLYRYRKTFGPGILFACTAIGVSHLVQSTRAGAEFGFMILGFVILANVLKYPFFEHGFLIDRKISNREADYLYNIYLMFMDLLKLMFVVAQDWHAFVPFYLINFFGSP